MLLSKKYFIYYAVLFVVLISWLNPYATPPQTHRILFLLASLVPITIKKSYLLAVVIPLFYAVSNYSSFVSYMPNQVYLYLVFPIIALLLHYRKLIVNIPSTIIFFFFLYTSFVNVVYSHCFESVSACCLLTYLLMGLVPNKKDSYAHILSYSFAVMSLTLSVFFIVSGTMFHLDYGADGFERTEWMDPNYFGCIIGIGAVASLIEVLYNKECSKIERLLFLLTVALSLYVLVSNGSRGALLATTVAFLIMFLGNTANVGKKILMLFVLGLFVYVLYANGVFDFLLYRIDHDSGGGSGRTLIWQKKLYAYSNQLTLFERVLGIGYKEGMHLAFGYSRGFHNDFIAILIEYGVIGIMFLLSLLLSPIIRANNKVIVISVIGYIAVAGSTLEPISGGMIVYFCFWLYAYVIGKSPMFCKTTVNSVL